MKRNITLVSMLLMLVSCTNTPSPEATHQPMTSQVVTPHSGDEKNTWDIYDSDPGHIWNRVFRQMYERTTSTGERYGSNELDPLLWFDTTYLLNGTSHQQAIAVLDEFLSTHGEDLIHDPLKRAMFQRDLWAVFDWAVSQPDPYPSKRTALAARLAQIIKRVALSKEEIKSLPDNYTLEVDANTFPADLPPDQPEAAFLPADIFKLESAWVPMGREGGPVAMTHAEAFPFFGRSVFLVFVRSPNGRAGTLDFIQSLNTEPNPVLAIGSDVALVRRMLLIDNEGELILSPLVETVQIRHFSPAQNFREFELNRHRLFDGVGGGLTIKSDLFMLFMSHGDVFTGDHGPELRATIPDICIACHFEYPPTPNSGNTRSIISYSRQPFALPDNRSPILLATTITDEAQTVIKWKLNHNTWHAFQALWNQTGP